MVYVKPLMETYSRAYTISNHLRAHSGSKLSSTVHSPLFSRKSCKSGLKDFHPDRVHSHRAQSYTHRITSLP
eukprot:488450-Amorphochlora_amoeboformis.AAC.2